MGAGGRSLITLGVQSRLSLREILLQSLLTGDGQTGSYRFARRISTDKRACVYEYRVNSLVVFYSEVEPKGSPWSC
jgi:hypothetical protein